MFDVEDIIPKGFVYQTLMSATMCVKQKRVEQRADGTAAWMIIWRSFNTFVDVELVV